MSTPGAGSSAPPPPSSGSSLPATCSRCGALAFGDGDGYCAACGNKLTPSRAVGGRPPLRLSPEIAKEIVLEERPQMAAGAHRGLRHARNEDAFALDQGQTARGEAFHILVVCDGVSSSSHPEQASRTAATVLRDTLANECRAGGIASKTARTAMMDAIRKAHVAVCAQGIDPEGGDPPGTTCVAALIVGRRLTVGWVGDSRAYWLTARGGELLTHDHSWANDAVDRGEATFEDAMRAPHAHALTRCLGPVESSEAPPVKPDVVTRELAGAGTILLCSDGLWNYYPMAEIMFGLVQRCDLAATPGELARFLVGKAIGRGGHDNISAAVYVHDGRETAPAAHGPSR